MKVSRAENQKHDLANDEDKKYEEDLEKKIAGLPSTWSRLTAMLRPYWALPAGIFLTVILSPSMIIQSYLMVDRVIYLILPLEAIPVAAKVCTPD
jgi:hypothetical protein